MERNWSSAGHPHSRDGVVIGTFRAFVAAHGHCVQTGFGSEQKVMGPGIAAVNLLSTGGSNFTGDLSVAVLHLCPSLNLTESRLPRQGCPWHRRCPEHQMSPACTRSPGSPKFPVFVPSFSIAMLCPGLEPCGTEGGLNRDVPGSCFRPPTKARLSFPRAWQDFGKFYCSTGCFLCLCRSPSRG